MLPDVVGGWLKPERVRYDLARCARRTGFEFMQGRIGEIDSKGRTIRLDGAALSYEYAILCTGSRTNFYGDAELEHRCYKLDDGEDALLLRNALMERAHASPEVNVVISGGGYTGVEIATNAAFLLSRRGAKHRVMIVERSAHALMALPDWVRREVEQNLAKVGVEVICGDALKAYDGCEAVLGSGRRIDHAVAVWAAGVRTSPFFDHMALGQDHSRIVVDQALRPQSDPSCGLFVAGDAASFADSATGMPLRMAVNFSLGQGRTAAENILRGIEGRLLQSYRGQDLGFLVPMANGVAPGFAKGVRVHGRLGHLLHYLMCVRRAEWPNKFGILRDFSARYFASAHAEKEG